MAPGVRVNHHVLQAAAVKNAAVYVAVFLIGHIQTRGIDIERVRVLHDELPHPQQTGLGPRFVAKFGLNLIPDLRQLLVAAQFLAGDFRHVLFVRHG